MAMKQEAKYRFRAAIMLLFYNRKNWRDESLVFFQGHRAAQHYTFIARSTAMALSSEIPTTAVLVLRGNKM
jgi:hypothetical protein